MVNIGDRVRIESQRVGSVTRIGTVTGIEGRMITVRWDSGSQSMFVPSAGCLEVIGHESVPVGPPQAQARAERD